MFKTLKDITVRIVAGANVALAVLMVLSGHADLLHPTSHPNLSCAGLAFPILLLINLGFVFFWTIFRFRYLLIPVAGFAASFGALRVYLPLSPQQDLPQGCIKVLSYNVQAFNGTDHAEEARKEIIDYIRECRADIVCLQEDSYPKQDGQALMDGLYDYSDTLRMYSETLSNSIGIYSRYPILKRERIVYPSRANGSMAYYLQIDGDTIIVINNHFESNHLTLTDRENYHEIIKGDVDKDTAKRQSRLLLDKISSASAIRAPQADSVARFINHHRHYPIIVCGDFNDNPISYTRRTVSCDLTDCYAATGRGPGFSFNQQAFYVRIDNILCSNHFTPYNCKVDNKIKASDHYPIFCWLKKR